MAKIKFDLEIKDFDKEVRRIHKEASRIANHELEKRVEHATEALASVTPVRTGYARSRWDYDMKRHGDEVYGEISNDAHYIGKLNQGTSQQAPAYFIEQVLMTVGELSSPVVDYKNEDIKDQ